MNLSLTGATALSGILVLAHIFGGGPEIHMPVLATELAPEIKAAVSVVWHGVTLVLIINTVLLLAATTNRPWGHTAAWIVVAQYGAFVVLFIAYGIIRLENLTQLPQWIAFLLIVVLTVLGLRRTPTQGAKS